MVPVTSWQRIAGGSVQATCAISREVVWGGFRPRAPLVPSLGASQHHERTSYPLPPPIPRRSPPAAIRAARRRATPLPDEFPGGGNEPGDSTLEEPGAVLRSCGAGCWRGRRLAPWLARW